MDTNVTTYGHTYNSTRFMILALSGLSGPVLKGAAIELQIDYEIFLLDEYRGPHLSDAHDGFVEMLRHWPVPWPRIDDGGLHESHARAIFSRVGMESKRFRQTFPRWRSRRQRPDARQRDHTRCRLGGQCGQVVGARETAHEHGSKRVSARTTPTLYITGGLPEAFRLSIESTQ